MQGSNKLRRIDQFEVAGKCENTYGQKTPLQMYIYAEKHTQAERPFGNVLYIGLHAPHLYVQSKNRASTLTTLAERTIVCRMPFFCRLPKVMGSETEWSETELIWELLLACRLQSAMLPRAKKVCCNIMISEWQDCLLGKHSLNRQAMDNLTHLSWTIGMEEGQDLPEQARKAPSYASSKLQLTHRPTRSRGWSVELLA